MEWTEQEIQQLTEVFSEGTEAEFIKAVRYQQAYGQGRTLNAIIAKWKELSRDMLQHPYVRQQESAPTVFVPRSPSESDEDASSSSDSLSGSSSFFRRK